MIQTYGSNILFPLVYHGKLSELQAVLQQAREGSLWPTLLERRFFTVFPCDLTSLVAGCD